MVCGGWRRGEDLQSSVALADNTLNGGEFACLFGNPHADVRSVV